MPKIHTFVDVDVDASDFATADLVEEIHFRQCHGEVIRKAPLAVIEAELARRGQESWVADAVWLWNRRDIEGALLILGRELDEAFYDLPKAKEAA